MTQVREDANRKAAVIDFHLEREKVDEAAEVSDGFWVIATKHHPGLSKHMFEINNRCLVLRLFDASVEQTVLVVVNAVAASAIPEVRRIERETGIPVRYIISPGGGHHLLLEPWHNEFTEARVLLPGERIPRTAHGKTLMQLPRVSTIDPADPLPQFGHELQAVLFRGLLGPLDHQTPAEGAPDTRWNMVRTLVNVIRHVEDPVDELWLYHSSSRTVIGGENLSVYYTTDQLRGQPLMLRAMVKPDRLAVQTMARKVADTALVTECWHKVLAWPALHVMTYHDPPGTAVHGDAQKVLHDAARAAHQVD